MTSFKSHNAHIRRGDVLLAARGAFTRHRFLLAS